MKRQLNSTIFAAALVALPLLAQAEHGQEVSRGFAARDLQWRLGPAVSRVGHEILYKVPGDRRWRRAPGEAVDVADGWVIGTDRRNGGYSIYRWNGFNWDRAPGAGVDIGGSYNNPWVINDRGERFAWNGYDWRRDGYSRQRSERSLGNSWRGRDRDEDHRDHGRNERDRDDYSDRDRRDYDDQ